MPTDADTLRALLAVWEREAAAQWQAVIRSPHFLRTAGQQLFASLRSQQRVRTSLQAGDFLPPHPDQTTYLLYHLERLEKEIELLAERIDRLEQTRS